VGGVTTRGLLELAGGGEGLTAGVMATAPALAGNVTTWGAGEEDSKAEGLGKIALDCGAALQEERETIATTAIRDGRCRGFMGTSQCGKGELEVGRGK